MIPRGATGGCPPEPTAWTRRRCSRDQRERLQSALIELIAQRGYQAVRIVDLTRLAHVSRPTFYEPLRRQGSAASSAPTTRSPSATAAESCSRPTAAQVTRPAAARGDARLHRARGRGTGCDLAVPARGVRRGTEGPRAPQSSIAAMEQRDRVRAASTGSLQRPTDLIVRIILGGVREVAAARLQPRAGRTSSPRSPTNSPPGRPATRAAAARDRGAPAAATTSHRRAHDRCADPRARGGRAAGCRAAGTTCPASSCREASANGSSTRPPRSSRPRASPG